tara:strand:- start:394 stop:552 length:159 start_codon:yes stop_codon:yes gene_type:complete
LLGLLAVSLVRNVAALFGPLVIAAVSNTFTPFGVRFGEFATIDGSACGGAHG